MTKKNKHTLQFKIAWNLTGDEKSAMYFESPVIPLKNTDALGQSIRVMIDKITAGWESHWQETYQSIKDSYKHWNTEVPRAVNLRVDLDGIELIRTQDNTLPNQFPQCFHELGYRLAEGLESMKYELTSEEKDILNNGGILEKPSGMTLMSNKIEEEE